MSNEIEKVLRLVEEGKINAKEGARLIELIKAPKDTKATKERPTNKSLRIKVFEQDSQQINVTIPIRLVQVLLKLGKGIATVIPESNKYITEEENDLSSRLNREDLIWNNNMLSAGGHSLY